jgi:glycosyltransferase involved in cell wall biosynthesis
VPNGVDPDAFAPLDVLQRPGRMIFTGLVDYRPNYDGITWFVDEVFPRVRRTHPNAELLIVGQGSPQALDQLRRPGVIATGRVPDLTPYLAEAEVSVIPLRIGGGTRLKLVEAMSMGKAVVSTSLGAEGIDALHGTHVMLADEPASFAEAVSQLLDSADVRHRLGRQARALAMEKYSWSRSAQLMEDLHRDVVPGRGAGRLPMGTDATGAGGTETERASAVAPGPGDWAR